MKGTRFTCASVGLGLYSLALPFPGCLVAAPSAHTACWFTGELPYRPTSSPGFSYPGLVIRWGRGPNKFWFVHAPLAVDIASHLLLLGRVVVQLQLVLQGHWSGSGGLAFALPLAVPGVCLTAPAFPNSVTSPSAPPLSTWLLLRFIPNPIFISSRTYTVIYPDPHVLNMLL